MYCKVQKLYICRSCKNEIPIKTLDKNYVTTYDITSQAKLCIFNYLEIKNLEPPTTIMYELSCDCLAAPALVQPKKT